MTILLAAMVSSTYFLANAADMVVLGEEGARLAERAPMVRLYILLNIAQAEKGSDYQRHPWLVTSARLYPPFHQ